MLTGLTRGDELGDGSEQQLAEAMIRLYGRDAESVAVGHAETHADMGDQVKSDRWQRIAEAIAAIRRLKMEAAMQPETPAKPGKKVSLDS